MCEIISCFICFCHKTLSTVDSFTAEMRNFGHLSRQSPVEGMSSCLMDAMQRQHILQCVGAMLPVLLSSCVEKSGGFLILRPDLSEKMSN